MLMIEAKIKLYFASPTLTRQEYQQLEIELTDTLQDPVRYSPLHIRRQEIYYSMGINAYTGKDFAAELGFGPLNTMGISSIVSQCAILGSRFFKDELRIFTEFMDIDESLARSLKKLRDADQHGLSSLRYSGRAGEPRKLFFLTNTIQVPIISSTKKNDREDYFVSPKYLHNTFEKAMDLLRDYFLDSKCRLRDHFDQTITTNNWYRFSTPQAISAGEKDYHEVVTGPSEALPLN